MRFEDKFWRWFIFVVAVFIIGTTIYSLWSFAKWYVLITCSIGLGKELYKYYTKHADYHNLNLVQILLLGLTFMYYPISKVIEVFTKIFVNDAKNLKTGNSKSILKQLK
ncbi:hypothetical protein O0Q50_19155 [Priestia aryabhattai]|uniref:Uncharacterized protein n=1 Tax=Priestia aryabhattai TaxID=412384 RepID=A0AAX6NBQ0_PRIAR|nr:hypothetical protein [Priestia aryabhattai]MDU9693292.1 hypothetical protein [Priestia aryabhattai]